MNATQLFHQDGRSAGVFYCTSCRRVHREESIADVCCTPSLCRTCAEPAEQYRTTCRSCDDKRKVSQEAARFEAAEKVTDFDGWVYAEGLGGYRDGYFGSVGELMDHVSDERPDDEELSKMTDEEKEEIPALPAYAWTCDEIRFAHLDIQSVLDLITDSGDAYEDFDSGDLKGVTELKAALDAFNKANSGIVSYFPNYERAVLLNVPA